MDDSSSAHSQDPDDGAYTTPASPLETPYHQHHRAEHRQVERANDTLPPPPSRAQDQSSHLPRAALHAGRAQHDSDAAQHRLLRGPSSPEDLKPPQLERLFSEERHRLYASWWARAEVQLKDLDIPDACKRHPDLSEEILLAYLRHITLVVEVWANYDSYTGRLFRQTPRVDDCGKLYLSDRQRTRVYKTFDTPQVQFRKVRMNVGTAFRTLANLYIRAVPSVNSTDHGLRVQYTTRYDEEEAHDTFHWLLHRAMKTMIADGVADGQTGLTLSEIDHIAKEFRFNARSHKDIISLFRR